MSHASPENNLSSSGWPRFPKWFNGLYLQVTQAVESSLGTGHWNDPDWLRALDVNFASLYFTALQNDLQGSGPVPMCWKTVFDARDKTHLARIQFALAGINSHVNHDLSSAVVTTCDRRGVMLTLDPGGIAACSRWLSRSLRNHRISE